MKILYYTPFKSLGHPHPSGDLATATGIYDFLVKQGHQVIPASSLRCRWIYWKPWMWLKLIREKRQVVQRFDNHSADLWFTYHSYYKAPDLLGPAVSRTLNIPYVIFQGIYSTKRRRRWITRPGFYLNKNTLCRADHVFANKSVDLHNLKRLLPENRLTYVAPGLIPSDFSFDAVARRQLRKQWNVIDEPVIFSAAMFRPDVKTEGLIWVIRACGELHSQGQNFRLVIAGDGRENNKLRHLADKHAAGRVIFLGKIPRQDMFRCYSAADLFVFPGIRESLGMVFLEAQSCGLPVIAFNNAGVPEAVRDGKTGLLVSMKEMDSFVGAINRLVTDKNKRQQMGRAAKSYVRQYHDLNKNYQELNLALKAIVHT
ncbi:MAG: glycosyltransferase family 4 protein [bacterium]|nr:glycosyltransferase family 4 protein [bacterium]